MRPRPPAWRRGCWDACRAQARPRARRPRPADRAAAAGWDDLVLPGGPSAGPPADRRPCPAPRHRVYRRPGDSQRRAPRARHHRAVRRPQRHRQDDGRRGARRRAAARPLPHRPQPGRQQVHRRDREEPAAGLRRRRGRRRDPAVRRGRRPVRQAQRGQGQPRPLRQHRGQLPAAADGGLSRAGDPDHQPEERARPGVPAAHPVRRPVSRSPTRRSARRSGGAMFPAPRRPRVWTSPCWPGSTWPAATSATSR